MVQVRKWRQQQAEGGVNRPSMESSTHAIPIGVVTTLANSFVGATVSNAASIDVAEVDIPPTALSEVFPNIQETEARWAKTAIEVLAGSPDFDIMTWWSVYLAGSHSPGQGRLGAYDQDRSSWRLLVDMSMDSHMAILGQEITRGINVMIPPGALRFESHIGALDWLGYAPKETARPRPEENWLNRFSEYASLILKPWFVRSIATAGRKASIRRLEKIYSFRNQTEVVRFIESNLPHLSVLESLPTMAQDHFPGCGLALEVVVDPETTDSRQLVVYISTSLSPEEAVERLDRFDHDWWLDKLQLTAGKLGINLEFR